MHDEGACDSGLSFADEIKRAIFETVDRLKAEIQRRFEAAKLVNDQFTFLQLCIIPESGAKQRRYDGQTN
jgi:hypothetical protein